MKRGARVEREVQLRGEPARAQVADPAHEAGIEVRASPAARGRWSSDRRSRPRSRAAMRSPDSSTTPAARSASTRIRFTGAAVRISAPAAPRGLASASQSAPCPPAAGDSPPAPAAASAARRYSSVSTVPGERGPKLVPSTASNPSAPLSSGDPRSAPPAGRRRSCRRCAAARACRAARACGSASRAAASAASIRRTRPCRAAAGPCERSGARARGEAAHLAAYSPIGRRSRRPERPCPDAEAARRSRPHRPWSAWIARAHFSPCALEVQLAHQIAAHQMHQVGARRHVKAGGELARQRRAADLRLRLEHQHRAAARAPAWPRRQSVVARRR